MAYPLFNFVKPTTIILPVKSETTKSAGFSLPIISQLVHGFERMMKNNSLYKSLEKPNWFIPVLLCRCNSEHRNFLQDD